MGKIQTRQKIKERPEDRRPKPEVMSEKVKGESRTVTSY
jgi:hypothetical protein